MALPHHGSDMPDEVLTFGEGLELDRAAYELRRGGLRVKLERIPMETLLLLVERRGQLVTRDDIVGRVWGKDVFLDTDTSINSAIRKIRQALRDDPENPAYIQTITGMGYRFIAPISMVAPGSATAPLQPAPEPVQARENTVAARGLDTQEFAPVETVTSSTSGTAPTSSPAPVVEPGAEVKPVSGTHVFGTRWGKVSLAVAVLALVGTGIWMAQRWHTGSQPESRQPRITSLAVLPLTNMIGDNKQEYFVDGMTDELTTSLAQISGLRVISETSSRHYRGTSKTVPEIARELGVDGVVEGAVARSGDHVRITAQLISAKDDRHLWAESFERNATDALGLQHEVARAIADRIQVTLTPAEAHRLETLPTRNPAAYDAYLRAKYLGGSGLMVKADNEQSIAAAEEAVALDPGFAEAYVAVAFAHAQQIFGWAGGKDDDEKAIVALNKAIALNPNLAEAYVVRGYFFYNHFHGFDIVNAVADHKKAIALNPNSTEAQQALGQDLTHAGLHDRAIEEFRTALALDPMNGAAKYRLSRALWQSQRFEESLQNYERYNIKAIEEALPLAYLRRRQQAWDLVAELTPMAGSGFRSHDDFPAVRALLDAMDGNAAKAEREIQESIRLGKTDDHFHHAAFIIAAAYAEMGKPHEAVEWLRRTAEIGMPNYPLFHDNPSMKKLYGNPEYEQFMAEFKPRWEQFANNL